MASRQFPPARVKLNGLHHPECYNAPSSLLKIPSVRFKESQELFRQSS
jgi:hypothetical protein